MKKDAPTIEISGDTPKILFSVAQTQEVEESKKATESIVPLENIEVYEGSIAKIPLNFSNLPEGTIIEVKTTDGTATSIPEETADYSAIEAQTLVVEPGQTSTTLEIPIHADNLQEKSESFFVEIAVKSEGGSTTFKSKVTINDGPNENEGLENLNLTTFGNFSQPDSLGRDLELNIGFANINFDDLPTIREDLPLSASTVSDGCPPPANAITAAVFCNLVENNMNVVDPVILAYTINDLRDVIKCINEYSNNVAPGQTTSFTIFLGTHTFDFIDLTGKYSNPGFYFENDQNTDLDINLDADDFLTITGCGCDKTILDGQELGRIFDIGTDSNVFIKDLQIRGGSVIPEDFSNTFNSSGGGIRNQGELTVEDICVIGNKALVGGGIFNGDPINGDATLTIINSEFEDNRATEKQNIFGALDGGEGGAIYNENTIELITGTTFIQNSADTTGGGIHNEGLGNIKSIEGSLFQQNTADSGGAIAQQGGAQIGQIENTTFDQNTALVNGGGIYASLSSIAAIVNSTISANIAQDGAGLYAESSSMSLLLNSTFSGNIASDEGGGIYLENSTITEIAFNTIAHNTAASGDGIFLDTAIIGNINNSIVAENTNNDDIEGALVISNGYNIIGSIDGAIYLAGTNDLTGTDATPQAAGLVDTLALNGSANGTKTHALESKSAAIDSGDYTGSINTDPTTDQRGFVRPVDGDNSLTVEPDRGAYEFASTVVPIVFDLDGDGVELIHPSDSKVTLLGENGILYKLGWVSGQDGILVYDLNQDNIVNSLAEIELSRYHPDATTDLQGLKLGFDTNFDNLFNALDDEFSSFGLWRDYNENGVTEVGEYQTLIEAGITELDLSATEQLSWVEGNYVFAEGDFSMANGNQKIFGDVALSLKAVLPENISGLDVPQATFNEYQVAMDQPTTIQFSDVVVEQAIQEASNTPMPEI